mmetsp:Transcript_18728/g.52090  ORF Transcript_18728/g.52090 Transcript_18728/m.52090 type:complete len:148 (+) Transcript_18728:1242-1685(+)
MLTDSLTCSITIHHPNHLHCFIPRYRFSTIQGRLEAYLPENKVYMYQRPSHELWKHRNVPPPAASIQEQVFECSDVKEVHGIDCDMPTHGGYHYSSTGVEWHFLLSEIKKYNKGGSFHPQVSLDDGIRAVEIGIQATASIVNATNEA